MTQERIYVESDPVSVQHNDELEQEKPTPLPKLQLFSVFLIQTSEALTATVIYPFINQFVRETGIIGGDEKKTGYYAGLIVRISTATSQNARLNKAHCFRSPHSSLQRVSPWSSGVISQIVTAADQYYSLDL
jgi:hypothetical protein